MLLELPKEIKLNLHLKDPMKFILISAVIISVSACKMPEPKEKEPVDPECLAKVETVLKCKAQEASGLDADSARLITKAVDANRKQANISTERCQKILGQYANDPCSR